jgi:hypothetical protein
MDPRSGPWMDHGARAIVMERVHGQAQESGQEMSDDAPVGRVILDVDKRMGVYDDC